MKKTILFDLDGTLIDSTPAILDGFDTAFKTHGQPLPDHEKIKSLVGYPLDVMFEELRAPKDLVTDYIRAYKKRYEQIYLDQTTLLKFARDALKLANSFANVGIVTTKTSKFSAILLKHLGVMQYIDIVIGRDDVKRPKPDPEPVNLALARLGKDSAEHRQNAFMIGDTLMDMLAAKAAGVTGLGLLCGYGTLADLQGCTDLIFENALKATEYGANL